MKKTLSIEAVHHLYAGELGHALTQLADVSEKYKAQSGDDGQLEQAKPYTVVDGIAVYKISGPLITNGSWWSRYLGYTAYDDIRADLSMAVADPDVEDILLFMGTPGGSVFGVTDAADALKKVASVKPLYVYSAKNVASGGYWLAANAGTLIGSPESEWGSIGVIVTHFSYEKRLEEDGIKVTVIKSDELKAVGGPYKDLTDKEISHIKAQVDQYNDLFHEHVRTQRPGVRLSSMHGETYIGEEALHKGLIDAVMSYDQTIDYIKSKRTPTTQTGGYRMKMTAEELKAAIEGGASLESLGLTEEEAAEIQASATEPETHDEETETSETEQPDVGAMQEQLVAMQSQLDETAEKLAAAEGAVLKAQADSKMVADMKAIVADIVNSRRIALRLPKMDMSAFSAESLIADYHAVTDQFNTTFKTGGLFKKDETPKQKVAQNSVHARQLDAAA